MGKKVRDLPTPAVLVDGAVLQRNINRMAETARRFDVTLRPHAKAHKTVEIVRLQQQAGADGATVATLREARVLVEAGIDKITVATPLWGDDKLSKAAFLSGMAELTLLVTDGNHADHLNRYFSGRGITVPVQLKVDTGLRRCGRRPEEIDELFVSGLCRATHLRWSGWLTHAGHSYGARNPEELTAIARYEADALVQLQQELGPEGATVSIGSTPTAPMGAAVPGVTEIRPGNYVFNDRMQLNLGVARPEDLALTVLTQVIDRSRDRVVLDAGAKTLGLDSGVHGRKSIEGFGEIVGTELVISRLSEEHGIIEGKNRLECGQFVEIRPNHACPVANLADRLYIRDGNSVIDVFRVEARGHAFFD